jgi:photosystem II stability/assembly factor-like uncharacterized protein
MINTVTVVYREMVRINPENPFELQWKSDSMGHSWFHRYTSENLGEFIELEFEEPTLAILAKTDNGSYYSTNGGRHWLEILEEV